MSTSLKLIDKTLGQAESIAWVLKVVDSTLTVREIVRRRVYEEVSRINARQGEVFTGLVQPTDAERVLNGYKLRTPRKIDWEQQFTQAVLAFESNRLLILVGDRQVEDLDEELRLDADTNVTFLRLVPLVGG